jgi:hypothetical protein
MARIFISYRRDDTEMVAGRLAKDLRSYFGEETVFRDKESIPVGADWAQEINHAIGPGGVVLVLIGEDWLEGKPKGQRRLDDPQDPHRNEIGAALNLGVTVLPLLVRNMKMPPTEELPQALQRLPALNAMKLRDDEWEGFDFPRLAKVLEKAGFKPRLAQSTAAPTPVPDSKKPTSAKAIWALVLGVLGLGAGSASSQGDAGFALFVALMAALLAFFGFRDARAGRVKGERLAIGGMVAGAVATLLAVMALGRTGGGQSTATAMLPATNLTPSSTAPLEALPAPAAPVAALSTPEPVAVQANPAPAPAQLAVQKPKTTKVRPQPQQQPVEPVAASEVVEAESTQPQEAQAPRNLSGLWVDASDGTHVQIQQDGAALVAAILQGGGQIGGVGSVKGRQVEIIWGAAGVPVMTSTLKLSANGNELRGPSVALNGQSETTVLHRQRDGQ